MKKHGLSLLTFLAMCLLSCSQSNSGGGSGFGPGETAKKTQVRIKNKNPNYGMAYVLGDSLAAGSGAKDLMSTPMGCLNRIQKDAKSSVKVRTFSHDGATSLQTLDQLKSLSDPPHLVFVSAGGNDAAMIRQGAVGFSQKETLENMEKIFDQLHAKGALVMYLALNPPVAGFEMLQKISGLAESKGVLIVDGMKDLWTDSSKMADSVHPNDAGYKVMCDRMLEALKGNYP